jgi:hypothetical protein
MLELNQHIFWETVAVYSGAYMVITSIVLLNELKTQKKWIRYILFSFLIIGVITIIVDNIFLKSFGINILG